MRNGSATKFAVLQNGATATGNGATFATADPVDGAFSQLGLQVLGSGTYEITWEATVDEVNWVAVPVTALATATAATTATAAGLYRLDCRGLAAVRARISSRTTGTIYVYALGVLG